jgi:hypothetical protein
MRRPCWLRLASGGTPRTWYSALAKRVALAASVQSAVDPPRSEHGDSPRRVCGGRRSAAGNASAIGSRGMRMGSDLHYRTHVVCVLPHRADADVRDLPPTRGLDALAGGGRPARRRSGGPGLPPGCPRQRGGGDRCQPVHRDALRDGCVGQRLERPGGRGAGHLRRGSGVLVRSGPCALLCQGPLAGPGNGPVALRRPRRERSTLHVCGEPEDGAGTVCR